MISAIDILDPVKLNIQIHTLLKHEILIDFIIIFSIWHFDSQIASVDPHIVFILIQTPLKPD